MSDPRTRPDGTPCWAELPQPFTPELARFYTATLGWEFDQNSAVGGYVRSWRASFKVAGIGGAPLPGAASWRVYLSVRDLAGALKRAASLGGRALTAPVDISPEGMFAFVEDSSGFVVGLFEAQEDPGTARRESPGCVVDWHLNSPTPEASRDFYTAMLRESDMEAAVRFLFSDGFTGWRPVFGLPEGSGDPDRLEQLIDPAGNHLLVRGVRAGAEKVRARPEPPRNAHE